MKHPRPITRARGGPRGGGAAPVAEPVPLVLTATTAGAHVKVRDGAGRIVFSGSLAVGQVEELRASPPVRVQSSDGGLTVALDGAAAKPVGEPGVAGQGTFVPR